MKEDIIGGIKNALERGETIDKAIQTFVNAGYSPDEVRDAAAMISQGSLSVSLAMPEIKLPSAPPMPIPKNETQQANSAPMQIQINPEQKKHSNKLLIGIIIFLLVFTGALVSLMLFSDKILTFMG